MDPAYLPFRCWDENLLLAVAHYTRNGALALVALDQSGQEFGRLTVNLPQALPAEGCVFIKNWFENEGVLEALEAQGYVKWTGRLVPTGHSAAHEAKILFDINAVPWLS